MFRSKYKVCELFDIPIFIESSFVFLLILFTLDMGSFSMGLSVALVLAISVTAHELAHALTARLFGYRTNDITLSLLGGCASLIALPRKAWQEFLTALAGPLMSFLIAGISVVVLSLGVVSSHYLYFVFYSAYLMNLMLGGFNLLPGFPMDGGRIFRSLMQAFVSRPKATLVAMWVGRVFAVLLGLKGLWSMVNGGGFGFITLMIAWMIWKEGWREYQLALTEENFRNWSQADFNARVSPPPYD